MDNKVTATAEERAQVKMGAAYLRHNTSRSPVRRMRQALTAIEIETQRGLIEKEALEEFRRKVQPVSFKTESAFKPVMVGSARRGMERMQRKRSRKLRK